MHAEEAEIVARTKTRHDQLLLGLRGRRLFQNALDLVEASGLRHASAADRAEIGEHVFTRRLHGRHAALLRFGDGDKLLAAAAVGIAHIEMVAHKMQERLAVDELAGRADGIAVAKRLWLRNQLEPGGRRAGSCAESRLIAGPHDDAHFVGPGGHGLFDDDFEGCFGRAVAVDEPLQGQALLLPAGGGDEGAFDVHGDSPAGGLPTVNYCTRLGGWPAPTTGISGNSPPTNWGTTRPSSLRVLHDAPRPDGPRGHPPVP